MKKVFVLLLVSLLLASCAGEAEVGLAPTENAPSEAEIRQSQADGSSESESEPVVDLYADLTEDETAIRKTSDTAVYETFGNIDLQPYEITVSERTDGEKFVRYKLMLLGYRTGESYTVRIGKDGTVEGVWGEYGEYARYLDTLTEQALRDAEARLQEQLEPYGNSSGGYLAIDKEGWLCLQAEVIIEGVEGCCGGHDHRFFEERICRGDERS